MYERDLQVHVANIERWMGKGWKCKSYRGIGAGVDVYLRTKPKAKLLLELMGNFTTLGDGERRMEPCSKLYWRVFFAPGLTPFLSLS